MHIHQNTNIKAVILAGRRDFGRCPLASQLLPALWPILDKPAVLRLLEHLKRQGFNKAVICACDTNIHMLKAAVEPANKSMELMFISENLPAGTAGCLRDAADGDRESIFILLPAAMVCPPEIDILMQAHLNGNSELTVFLENTNDSSGNIPSDIYIAHPSVIEHIPHTGYCDIKECLIPAMLRAGKTIHPFVLSEPAGRFREVNGYLAAMDHYLHNGLQDTLPSAWQGLHQGVWAAPDAKISKSAIIHGPVVLMPGATVSDDSLVFGPAVIGQDSYIGPDTIIENSILWDASRVGRNCHLNACVCDYEADISNNFSASHQALTTKVGLMPAIERKIASTARNTKGHFAHILYMAAQLYPGSSNMPVRTAIRSAFVSIAAGIILISAFIWCYWYELTDLWNIWISSDEYSSSLLVPFLAGYVLWQRRDKIMSSKASPVIYSLAAILFSQGLRIFGMVFMYGSAQRFSLIITLAAIILLLFGWDVFRKLSPLLAFSFLILPLPRSIYSSITLMLQNIATQSSVFCLELLGFNAIREGNIIHLGTTSVAIAEACNGLRMITAFLVITFWVALLVNRTWWEKCVLVVSSLPIALFCNSARLTLTAIAFMIISGDRWESLFHDFGGYAMMPLAIFIVVLELWLFRKLTVVYPKTRYQALSASN